MHRIRGRRLSDPGLEKYKRKDPNAGLNAERSGLPAFGPQRVIRLYSFPYSWPDFCLFVCAGQEYKEMK